jgi:TPR repeat protein
MTQAFLNKFHVLSAKKAKSFFTKASIVIFSLGTIQSSYADMFKGTEALDAKNYAEAAKHFEVSARIGNSDAQNLLGLIHYQGLLGKVDKHKALAWMYLAAENDHPNSMDYVQVIYNELPADEQEQALASGDKLLAQFGKRTLSQTLYPTINSEAISSQKIDTNAKMLKRGPLEFPRGIKSAINRSTYNSTRVGVYAQQGGISRDLVSDDSGVVILKYSVGLDGQAKDIDVLFSWPKGRFDLALINSIQNSSLSVAKRDEEEVIENGKIASASFGLQGADNFKTEYPSLYRKFKKYRENAANSPKDQYLYANYLRAYGNLLSPDNYENFEVHLKEAADKSFPAAMFDYAQYQIFVNNEVQYGLTYLMKAAKMGYFSAQYSVGDILENSPYVYLEEDKLKALKWYKMAAMNGYKPAQKRYARLLLDKSLADADEIAISVLEQSQILEWLEIIEDESETDDALLFYLLAKYQHITNDSKAAKKSINEAISLAKDINWDVTDWEAFKATL